MSLRTKRPMRPCFRPGSACSEHFLERLRAPKMCDGQVAKGSRRKDAVSFTDFVGGAADSLDSAVFNVRSSLLGLRESADPRSAEGAQKADGLDG